MTLTVTPTTLTEGGTAEVCIQGGAPNTTAEVDIDNGGDGKQKLEIELDENGNGCEEWSVPASGWAIANFNHGDCLEITRIIDPP